jgi:SAM-dependent methyltransferase
MEYNPDICDLCESQESKTLLSGYDRSFTSDTRIVKLPLNKRKCLSCGLVRNGLSFSSEFLQSHYENDYILGTDAATQEPLIFTSEGVVERSKIVFDWIINCLQKSGIEPGNLSRILEIGCGEGSVLQRFSSSFKNLECSGIEMNTKSAEIANRRKLTVAKGTYENIEGEYDLIYSFAVIEHVPSPMDFLKKLKRHLKKGGVIVVAQPSQDYGSSDIFFSDHLYHFNSYHITRYGSLAGMKTLYYDNSHEYLQSFSMHVFVHESQPVHIASISLNDSIENRINDFINEFHLIDKWIKKHPSIGVWGVGQKFVLLSAYTILSDIKVDFAIDDNPKRYGYMTNFPVLTSTQITEEMLTSKGILFTFRPGNKITSRLSVNSKSA